MRVRVRAWKVRDFSIFVQFRSLVRYEWWVVGHYTETSQIIGETSPLGCAIMHFVVQNRYFSMNLLPELLINSFRELNSLG